MSDAAALLPVGFRDRLPPEAEAASRLTRIMVDAFRARGYSRVSPPLAEHEPSLTRWLGKPTAAALLRSADPASGQSLAFRPDITGQVARIAATRLEDAPRPLRLAYAGPVLRARAGQLDPARERIQAGAELIGSDSIAALAELIGTALAALTSAGVTDLTVDITTPDLVARLAETRWPVSDLDRLLAALDGKDAGALATPELAPYRRLLECAGDAEGAMAVLHAMDPELSSLLGELVTALPGVRVTIDPTERHGFDYQSRIGFSLFGSAGQTPFGHEIGRGGTYRVRHLDGRLEPAAGVSLYVDPLVDAGLGQEPRRRIFLPPGTPAAIGESLRADGWCTVAALSEDDTPSQCSHIWNGKAAVAKD